MRNVRWKSSYLTRIDCLDTAKTTLFETLKDLADQVSRVEHCRDIEDLLGELNTRATALYAAPAPDGASAARVLGPTREDLARILDQGLPLAALGTPSCHDCGMCDATGERLRGWIDTVRCDPEGTPAGPDHGRR